jgi:hypothetical protein
MLSRPKHRYLRSNATRTCSVLFSAISLPCNVVNISEGGARLTFPLEGEALPVFFLLFFSASEPIRNCRLVWREGSSIGIRFLD